MDLIFNLCSKENLGYDMRESWKFFLFLRVCGIGIKDRDKIWGKNFKF